MNQVFLLCSTQTSVGRSLVVRQFLQRASVVQSRVYPWSTPPPPLHLCAKITSGTTAAFFGDASVFPSCFRPPNGRSAAGVAHADAERRRKQAVGAPQRHVVRGRRRWRCRRRRWRGGGAELRRQRRLRLGQLGRGGGGRQQGAWSEAGGGAVLHL